MNRYVFGLFVVAAGVMLAAPAYGVVPPISPLEFAESPQAHWIWTLLASEVVAALAGFIYWQIYKLIENTRYAKALVAIKDAVTACHHEYVRVAKPVNGKLTIEQKNEALKMAYRMAIEFARTRGFDLLKVMAKETIMTLIERFVGEAKAPKAALAGPLVDLPY